MIAWGENRMGTSMSSLKTLFGMSRRRCDVFQQTSVYIRVKAAALFFPPNSCIDSVMAIHTPRYLSVSFRTVTLVTIVHVECLVRREMNYFHTARHDCRDRYRSDMCGSEQTPSSTPRFSQFRHRQPCSKWPRLRRPLLLSPSSPLWPTFTTDSPNGR